MLFQVEGTSMDELGRFLFFQFLDNWLNGWQHRYGGLSVNKGKELEGIFAVLQEKQ